MIGQTIWNQITLSTKIALGAKLPVTGDNNLTFCIGRGTNHKVQIILLPSDTYKINYFKIRGTEIILLKTFSEIYNDRLNDVLLELKT